MYLFDIVNQTNKIWRLKITRKRKNARGKQIKAYLSRERMDCSRRLVFDPLSSILFAIILLWLKIMAYSKRAANTKKIQVNNQSAMKLIPSVIGTM